MDELQPAILIAQGPITVFPEQFVVGGREELDLAGVRVDDPHDVAAGIGESAQALLAFTQGSLGPVAFAQVTESRAA